MLTNLLSFLKQLFSSGMKQKTTPEAVKPQEPILEPTKIILNPTTVESIVSAKTQLLVNGTVYNFEKPARKVDRVFIHCTAASSASYSYERIKKDHIARGFLRDDGVPDIAYHYVIEFDGTLIPARALWSNPDAQKGHNTGTIAICLQGLHNSDFTQEQFDTLLALCEQIDEAYSDPKLTFHGHTEVANKTCPVFDYRKVLYLDADGHMMVNAA